MGRRLQQLVQTIASEADMKREGFTLCIQYHIWLKVTAVAYHDVYDKVYLSTTRNAVGVDHLKSVRRTPLKQLYIVALSESAFY